MEDLKGAFDRVQNISAADFAGMPDRDQQSFGSLVSSLVPEFPEASRRSLALKAVASLPPTGQQTLLREAIHELPKGQRDSLAATLAPPDGKTRDQLWKIVVGSFATVLVGSFLTLAMGVFFARKGNVEPTIVLSMFTSVVGFLAGLFVPSPANRTGPAAPSAQATDDPGPSSSAT